MNQIYKEPTYWLQYKKWVEYTAGWVGTNTAFMGIGFGLICK